MIKIRYLLTIFVCFFIFNLTVNAETLNKVGLLDNYTTYKIWRFNGTYLTCKTNQNCYIGDGSPMFDIEIANYRFEANKKYDIGLHFTTSFRGNNNITNYMIVNQDACYTVNNYNLTQEYSWFQFICTKPVNNITFRFTGNNEMTDIFTNDNFYNNYIFLSYYTDDTNQQLIDQNNIIINQNQTQIEQNNETNNKIDNLNDNLTSEELPNTDNLDNLVGFLPAGPIDSILNLPLSVLNSFLTTLNGQCKSINITLPFIKKNLELPCMYEYLSKMSGFTTLMDWISNIAGTILLIKYLISLYNWVDNQTSLNETNNNDWGGIS